MGVFSFLKNAGAKLFNFNKKEEAPKTVTVTDASAEAEALHKKQMEGLLTSIVTGLNIPVENLDVELDDDTVTVYGTAKSKADKEKVVLALGNVDGIAAVDDRLVVAEGADEADSVFYTVEKGDSLSKIAKAHYGDASAYHAIFEANKPMLDHPDKIYPGQVLRIPPRG
jgi:nucleoid-associated protein YgaU